MVDIKKLHPYLQFCIEEYENLYGKLQIISGWRSFEEQLELYRQGREKKDLSYTTDLILGKKLNFLADSGAIYYPKITNATPGTSAHNFGLAIDTVINGKLVAERFNKIIGCECFESGELYNDDNHIQLKGFKLPKYEYRYSLFFNPLGYHFLDNIGALQND